MTAAAATMTRPTRNILLTVFLLLPAMLVAWMIATAVPAPKTLPSVLPKSGSTTPGGAGTASENTSSVRPATQPAGNLVAPESLPQGFILLVEDQSKLASQASPIYLASNFFGNWNPGDAAFKLTPQSDMKWRIELPQPASWKDGKTGERMEFKFARGSWELEELKSDMSVPGNRTLPMIDASKLKPGEKPIIEFAVPHWGDERPEFKNKAAFDPARPITVAVGSIKKLQMTGGAGGAEGRVRDVLVWLPPGYDDAANATRTYPVLYMFDGQNLFEKHSGIADEWRVDETAGELIAKGEIEPLIIVGLPHGGAARISEYLPIDTLKDVKARGEEYLGLLKTQVMPRVERAFRVKTGREHTAIGGSSLGAAMAIYAATRHPDLFGKVLAESYPFLAPALADPETPDLLARESIFLHTKGWPKRIFLGMGGLEAGQGADKKEVNGNYVHTANAIKTFLGATAPDVSVKVLIHPEATHNEKAWAERLPGAMRFLFSSEVK